VKTKNPKTEPANRIENDYGIEIKKGQVPDYEIKLSFGCIFKTEGDDCVIPAMKNRRAEAGKCRNIEWEGKVSKRCIGNGKSDKPCSINLPHCGKNGVTYMNHCVPQERKVKTLCKGPCPCLSGCHFKKDGDVCGLPYGCTFTGTPCKQPLGICLKNKCIKDRASDTCKTVSGAKPNLPCHFPFILNGKKHNGCVYEGYDKAWCSTRTFDTGTHMEGHWGNCDHASCPIEKKKRKPVGCGSWLSCSSSRCKNKKDCEENSRCKWTGKNCQRSSCWIETGVVKIGSKPKTVWHNDGTTWKGECGRCRCNEGRVSCDEDKSSKLLLGKTLVEAKSMVRDMVICEKGVRMYVIDAQDGGIRTLDLKPWRLNVAMKDGKIVKILGSG